MRAWGISDVGLRRRENQDTYAIEKMGGLLCTVVCDGMGGANAGQTASVLAIMTYLRELRARIGGETAPQALRDACADSVAAANLEVYRHSVEDANCGGMGTTLVSAVSYPGGAVLCNVGDSRAYHIGAEGITRITRDHSVVENLIQSGDITPEEARTHPNRNLITRALGPERAILCDTFEVAFAPGELLLLCSDGLVVTLTDAEMLDAVRAEPVPQRALARLIALAKQNGAPDNVTAVLVEYR